MAHKYMIGQKVLVTPVSNQHAIPRDCTIESFAGQSGEIVDYHWINLPTGEVFIYTVRLNDDNKEVILHEDELGTYLM
ncbi:hypothetical protein ACFLVM_00780 [Chloroflexota bacterium]